MRTPVKLAVIALPAVVLAAFVARYGIVVPYWDQWELVPVLEKFYTGNLSSADLWAQHNAHRIFFPRVIMLGLAWLSHWNIRFELATNVMLGAGIFAAWCAILFLTKRRDFGFDRFPWLLAGSVAIFSMAQWRNWLWGWQLQIFLCVAAVLWVLAILAWRPRGIGLAAALVPAIVASYSFAAGLAVWPAGFVVIAWLPGATKEKRNALLLWATIAVAATALYLWGFEVPADANGPGEGFSGIVTAVGYVLAFLGGGLWNGHPNVALGLGVFGLIAYAVCVIRIVSAADTRHRAAPFVATAVFVVVSAVIASAGRSGEGIAQAVESRYSTFSGLFWIALIVLFDMVDRRRFALGAWHRPTPMNVLGIPMICFVIAIGLGANSVHGAYAGSQRGTYYNSLAGPLVGGGTDPSLERLYPDMSALLDRRDVLIRRGLTVFRGAAIARP